MSLLFGKSYREYRFKPFLQFLIGINFKNVKNSCLIYGTIICKKVGGGTMGLKRDNELHIRLTCDEKQILVNYAKANKISLNMALVSLIINLERNDKDE